jgi:hypothetical protein
LVVVVIIVVIVIAAEGDGVMGSVGPVDVIGAKVFVMPSVQLGQQQHCRQIERQSERGTFTAARHGEGHVTMANQPEAERSEGIQAIKLASPNSWPR